MADTPAGRPAWPFKIPIEHAKKLRGWKIVKITLAEEHDGFGVNSDSWLTLQGSEPKQSIDKFRTEVGFGASAEVQWGGVHYRGLLHLRQDIVNRLDGILAWDQSNARDRATYERLKRKFEGKTDG